jgi:hypothetical protein
MRCGFLAAKIEAAINNTSLLPSSMRDTIALSPCLRQCDIMAHERQSSRM